MLNLPIFIFILSVLIIVHELGHFLAAKSAGVRVEKFSLGFGPLLFKKKKGQTEYCISAIPLGGFVKLAGDNLEEYKGRPYEYYSKSRGARFKIIFAGPLLNYILGFLCFWLIIFFGFPTFTNKVGGLLEGYGAQEAGLKRGDIIIAVDGVKVDFWEELQNIIQEKRTAAKVKLSVQRGGKKFTQEVRITEQEVTDQLGQKHKVGLLGITPLDKKYGFFESFELGIKRTLQLTGLTYKGLWRIITGKLSVRESVTGPLGIFYITSKAASLGIIALLHLVAVLNISLALFNLLPLPVLDGGHILLLGIEKIRGKYLGLRAERLITQIGMGVILTLALLVTYNDIVRHFGDKIARIFK
jgi:regulator of sigma E protease